MGPPKTEEQKQKLIQEFREKTLAYITPGYWTTDEYIYRWLEAKFYRVDLAEKAFRKMLQWRIDNKIEGILDEDLGELSTENVVYFSDGKDKQGRPVICLPCNACSVKDKLTKEDRPRLFRVFYQLLERNVQLMAETTKESGGSLSVNTFVVIVDVADVDIAVVTPQVISLMVEISELCDNYYPGMMETTYIINASKAIKNIYTMIKPALRKVVTDRVKMFSNKKFKWAPVILENIEEGQLRERFGGILPDGLKNANPFKFK